MKKNLFDFINHQMFTLFATEKYRRMNYAILSFVYDFFVGEGKRRQTVPRPQLTAALKDFSSQNLIYKEDEEEEGQKFLTASDFANFKIRQLIKCGWLEEEPDERDKFSTVLLLSNGALTLMQAFHNIIDQYDRPISYLGYFYTVAMLLKDFDMTSAKSILDLVKKTTQELFNSLQGTNSVIKNFIDKLLADKDATPESIMSTFLIDYQKKVVVTALKNLIGKDNPSSTYLTGILHKLESLYTDELGEVVFHYSQELDQESIGNEQPLDVAKREVTEILQYCLESYRGVKEFIETIDQRNNRYHRNTREKIHFLANNRRDVEGKLTSAIKALKNIPNNADLEDVIPLEYIGLVDDHSFFSRTHTTTPKSSIHTQIPLVDPEEIERAKAEFQRQNLFSREEINRFVLELLGSHRSIRASEIPIQNYDDLYRLLLIRIYAQYPSMGYTLSEPEAEFVAFNHRMADFVIRRKEG